MDSLITAATRALASGDALGALNYIALRDDPPALALRGIAMAQLGDLSRAKILLRRAAHAFRPREAVARARCTLAEAEIALVSRDLNWPLKALDTAHDVLKRHGDHANAAHAHYLKTRYLLLIGRVDEAERLLVRFDPLSRASPSWPRPCLLLQFGCGASRGFADGSQFPAVATTAEERVAAIRFEARYRDAGRQ
jgi:tetratricopeptide (TPR) repeat protein